MSTDSQSTTHAPAEEGKRQFNLLVVDDAAENLDILVSNLRELYHVRGAISGESALEMVAKNRPDLILMDVLMPGMDGFETCRQLKNNKETADIPVIFVTSLAEVRDERIGFAAGGVDYITKPIIPAILCARVKTHLELSEARRAVQVLLNQTLSGTISIMTEVLSMANPMAFGRALRLRQLVQEIVKRIGRPDAWLFDLSAILSQLGCVTLPTRVLQQLQKGMMADVEDQERYDRYPELSAKLVARIPRLEEITHIVETHLTPPRAPFLEKLDVRPAVVLGAQLLKLAIEYDRLRLCGKNMELAIRSLQIDSHNYDPALVAILERVVTEKVRAQQVMLHGLRAGMVLAADMLYHGGGVVLREGTELTASSLNLIISLSREQMIQQPVDVLVPAE